MHLAAKAGDDPISDDEMPAHVAVVRERIHDSPCWSREMMNYVPLAVGPVHPRLFETVLATVKAYREIEVFYSDNTNCDTVDAVQELSDPKQPRARNAPRGTS